MFRVILLLAMGLALSFTSCEKSEVRTVEQSPDNWIEFLSVEDQQSLYASYGKKSPKSFGSKVYACVAFAANAADTGSTEEQEVIFADTFNECFFSDAQSISFEVSKSSAQKVMPIDPMVGICLEAALYHTERILPKTASDDMYAAVFTTHFGMCYQGYSLE